MIRCRPFKVPIAPLSKRTDAIPGIPEEPSPKQLKTERRIFAAEAAASDSSLLSAGMNIEAALKLKDERRRRVHLESEQKRRVQMTGAFEAVRRVACPADPEATRLDILLAANTAIQDLQARIFWLEHKKRQQQVGRPHRSS